MSRRFRTFPFTILKGVDSTPTRNYPRGLSSSAYRFQKPTKELSKSQWKSSLIDHHYEYKAPREADLYHANSISAVIVGAGGAGLRAAVELAQSGHKTCCVTKLVCASFEWT